MTAVVSLLSSPPEQDYIILGGQRSPGVATLRNAGSPRDWDIRKGYGFSGASVVFTGNGLAKFECDIYLWTPAHWIDWKTFSLLLAKPKGLVQTTGIGISHPLLKLPPLSIDSVVIEDVLQFEEDDSGGWQCTIKFIEFKRPAPALSKPLVAIPSASKAPPTAQDAVDREIQAKAARLKALAAGNL